MQTTYKNIVNSPSFGETSFLPQFVQNIKVFFLLLLLVFAHCFKFPVYNSCSPGLFRPEGYKKEHLTTFNTIDMFLLSYNKKYLFLKNIIIKVSYFYFLMK